MTTLLSEKRILVGVTGSIAAYKSADLIRRLKEAGAVVRVVMTENAKRFITPLTLQALSGYPIHDNLFDLQAEAAMGHIELARWAELILIAPASANCMAALAHGQASDLLTTLCLVTEAPIAIAPAMNQGMWHAKATTDNLQKLKQKNIHLLGPGHGHQACGEYGLGRMIEPDDIIKAITTLFSHDLLAGLRVVLTAGPTFEALDPVRYIANLSSGKMGYALAEAAAIAGARVSLISGPVHLPKPTYLDFTPVTTAKEMHEAVMKKMSACDIFLSVAAVSDYYSKTIAKQKIHKTKGALTLTLERNPDIVASVGQLQPKPFIVGFAAETDNLKAQARLKMKAKNMDLMIANEVGAGIGMGTDDNQVLVMSDEFEKAYPLMQKKQLAKELIPLIAAEYRKKYGR